MTYLAQFGIPDFRIDDEWFNPHPHTRKRNILGPKKETRDWLLNLYFRKPDYEEPHRKVYYLTYFGVKFAALTGMLDVSAMKSRNSKESIKTLARSFYTRVPYFATYGAVSTSIANMRHKDDYLNHFLAGCSLGFVYGLQHSSSGQGATFGFICGLLAMWFKRWHSIPGNNMFGWFDHRELGFSRGGDEDDYSVPSISLWTHHTKNRTEHYRL